jgi:hypothetical protein
MTHISQPYSVMVYVLFRVVRINGCIRRGRQPLLRGCGCFGWRPSQGRRIAGLVYSVFATDQEPSVREKMADSA